MESNLKRITSLGLLVSIGIVFGDIGTSPLLINPYGNTRIRGSIL